MKNIKYYKQLDGVRAIAALMVMFFHFFQYLQTSSPTLLSVQKIAVLGQTGVSLFFVLSGFLITRILIASRNDQYYFRNFYLRRAVRIFPLYYLFLLIFYFVTPLLFHTEVPAFGLQWYYWVYLQNFAITFHWPSAGPEHFWSLAVEEHFYLFWPLLIYIFRNRTVLAAIGILIIVSVVVRVLLMNKGFEVFYFTFSRMDELVIGAILSVLEVRNKLVSKNAGLFLLLLVLILIPSVVLWVKYSGSANGIVQLFKYTMLSLSYFCLIGWLICLSERKWINRVLQSGLLTFTGRISYGLYVYHLLCFAIFKMYFNTGNVVVDMLGSFALAIAVSTTSFYLFEAKWLKLKKYFTAAARKNEQPEELPVAGS